MADAPVPLLSIVVPFYNVGAYIGDCLDSLRSQLLDEVEVIMVDDGSTDGSRDVAADFVRRDPRFRMLQQQNQGLGPARNTGAAAASGKYLTFVDSDDLVAPRAYTALVGSLERSGSALAAGNAYRFSAGRGVSQSWTHRFAFAETRIATTLKQTPALVDDRMVWNKVYRRSFWDAGGFEFPAIRYEDYMVTLRAYLEAPTVDVLSDHVYFWRDRESGDSITQQARSAENARDRFTSASMVLDVLDSHSTSAAVRNRVRDHFAQVDVVALAESMVSVPAQDRPEAEHMALELARRLGPEAGRAGTRISRLVLRGLCSGDLDTVRGLADWRVNRDTRAFARELIRRPRPSVIPTALGAFLVRRPPQNPLAPRRLRASLTKAVWTSDVLQLTITPALRAGVAGRTSARAHLRCVDGRRLAAEATVRSSDGVVRVEVKITETDLVAAGSRWSCGELVLELSLAALRWRGPVQVAEVPMPAVHELPDGGWVQLRATDGVANAVGLQRLEDPLVIQGMEFADGRLVIEPAFVGSTFRVRRPEPDPSPQFAVASSGASIGVDQLVRDDPPDNIVTRIVERRIVATAPRSATAESMREVYCAADPVTTVFGEERVTVGRSVDGVLVVRREPVRPEVPTAFSAADFEAGELADGDPGEGVLPSRPGADELR